MRLQTDCGWRERPSGSGAGGAAERGERAGGTRPRRRRLGYGGRTGRTPAGPRRARAPAPIGRAGPDADAFASGVSWLPFCPRGPRWDRAAGRAFVRAVSGPRAGRPPPPGARRLRRKRAQTAFCTSPPLERESDGGAGLETPKREAVIYGRRAGVWPHMVGFIRPGLPRAPEPPPPPK